MKKLVIALLALVVVLGLSTVAFAATCTDDGSVAHTDVHTKTAVAPTCEVEGYRAYYCTACNKWLAKNDDGTFTAVADATKATKSESLGYADHNWGTPIVEESPTCTEDGLGTKSCDVCGMTLNGIAIPATDHQWVIDTDATVAATCQTAGVKVEKCINVVNGIACGETKSTPIAITNNWEKVPDMCKPVTCTVDGFDYYICKDIGCDKSKTVTVKATGHDWVDTEDGLIKEATCTEKGLKSQTCKKCNETRNVEIPAVGHKMSDWLIVDEATCEKDGLKTRHCTNVWCWNGFTNSYITEESEVIPARGHDWTVGEIIKAPTCDAEGEALYVCDCRATKVEAIEALGHDWSDWDVKVEATETTCGVQTRECKVCKKVEYATIPCLTPDEPEEPTDEPEEPTDEPTVKPDEPSTDANGTTGSVTGTGSDASIPATGDNTSNAAFVVLAAAIVGLAALAISKKARA